ncbi:MAG: hypothetical protein KDD52_06335 [Bdellovibrionales bacterium]|nr:hypothetical protein [Bdellovibrionales bacterium]
MSGSSLFADGHPEKIYILAMIRVGKMNDLICVRETGSGYFLKDPKGEQEVFLPPALADHEIQKGDKVRVFVYPDKKDQWIATMNRPLACVNEFAWMRVKEVLDFGAFFEWGIEKDLLVPGNQQRRKVRVGEHYIVGVCLEGEGPRIYGTTKINSLIQGSECHLQTGDTVIITPVIREPVGFRCIANQKHIGMIYHNEIFSRLQLHQSYEAYVKKIRSDGYIDFSLQKKGIDRLQLAKDTILHELKKGGGILHLHDRSDSQEIMDRLEMSKKTFKSAVGMLLKDKKIILGEDKILIFKK